MTLTTPEATAVIAACGVAAQFVIAHLARRQIAKQVDLQQLVSHRTTAAFVADKRQKWIDELRTDMAAHLASSQEILWKWEDMRSRTELRIQEEATDKAGLVDHAKANKIYQVAADAFSPENGARDREHHERHLRIMFRLNPEKELQIKLRNCLERIRASLHETQRAGSKPEANRLLNVAIRLISEAQEHTQAILKAEWQRVKQEVAYPEALMATIPKPRRGP